MISLTVRESPSHDAFKPLIRVDRATMETLGVVDGQIVYVTGKRKTVAKCMVSEKDSLNFALMSASVRNNAEVPIGGTVQIAKVDSLTDASKLVLNSTFAPKEDGEMGNLRNRQILGQMMAGFPAVKGDYIISLSMGAGWEVFEVVDIEASPGVGTETAASAAAIITPNTQIDIASARQSGNGTDSTNSWTPRRTYPLFVVAFQETIRKIDNDNIFLIMAFHGLHRDGRLGGEIQRKITVDTDIHSLASQIKEAAERTADLINEESRDKTISPDDVRNRIIQSVLAI